jgi:hypothetical protein
MAWSFVLTPGGDISAHVDISSITRTQRLHTALKPNSDKLDFRLNFDAATFQNLISSDDVKLIVLKDGSPYFSGYLSPNYKTTVRDGRKYINITAEDYNLQLLGKTIGEPKSWASYKVCDPATPASSLVHAIATLAGVSVGSGATISTVIPYVVVLPDEKMTWAKLLEAILFEYGHVYRFSEAGNLIVVPFINSSTVTTTGTLSAGTNIRGEMEIEKSPEKYDDIRIKYDLVELKTGIKLFQDTTGATDAAAATIPLAAVGDAEGKDYYPLTAKVGEVFSAWKNPDGYSIWIATSASITATYETGISVHQALVNYYKKCSFAYRNTSGSVKNIKKLEINGNAYVIKSKNTARSSIISGKELFEHEAKYIFNDTSAATLAKLIAQYYKYSDLKYRIKSNTVYAVGEYVTVTDAVYSGISAPARVVGVVQSSDKTTLTYDLEAVDDYVAVDIDTEGETAPIPGTPTYGDTVYYNNTPPTNNVEDLAISSADNPNGTVDVSFDWDYTQGAAIADGFLVFARREITTPDPINLNTDFNVFVPAGAATSYGTTINFPTRQAGAGSLPSHYRFGVVAMGTRRAGTVTHAGGVVELAGWIDKTFASVISIDAGNFWDQATGEMKVTVAPEKYLHLDPVNEEASLNNIPIRSYEGQGVNRRAIQIDNEALDWLDTPYTTPASPVQLRARIGRLGVGGSVLLDGDFQVSIPAEWGDEATLNGAQSYDPSYVQTDDGVLRVMYRRGSDGYIVERTLSGSVWGSEAVINAAGALYPTYGQTIDGQIRAAYRRDSDGYICERIWSGSAWGSESVINAANSYHPTYVVGVDGQLRIAYVDGQLKERIWSGSAWGSESVINAAGSYYPSYVIDDDDALRISYQRSDNYLVERIWSGSAWGSESVINAANSAYPAYIVTVDGQLRIAYTRVSDTYMVERIWSGSAWGSESVINAAASYTPAIVQTANGEMRIAYRKSDEKIYERTLTRYQSLSYPQSGFVAGRGWWQKDADGTLTQWGTVDIASSTVSNNNIGTYGWSLYVGQSDITLPIAYIDAAYSALASSYVIGSCLVLNTTSIRVFRFAFANETRTVSWKTIGRWK